MSEELLQRYTKNQIRTISKQRLKKRRDSLSGEESAQLRCLITEMYGE